MGFLKNMINDRKEKKLNELKQYGDVIELIDSGIVGHDEALSLIADRFAYDTVLLLASQWDDMVSLKDTDKLFKQFYIGPDDNESYNDDMDRVWRGIKYFVVSNDVMYSRYLYELPHTHPEYKDCTINNIVENYLTQDILDKAINDNRNVLEAKDISGSEFPWFAPTLPHVRRAIYGMWETVIALNHNLPVVDPFLGMVDKDGVRSLGVARDGCYGSHFDIYPHYDFEKYGAADVPPLVLYTGYIEDYVPYIVENFGDKSKWVNHKETNFVDYNTFMRYHKEWKEKRYWYFFPHVFSNDYKVKISHNA